MSDIESGNQTHNDSVILESGTQNSLDENKRKMKLYKAALSNNWKEAEKIYNAGMKYGVRITPRGETALHVAALASHIEFVQNLVQKMNVEEIRTETKSVGRGKGNTAFHCAVISGNVKIAKAIMKCVDLHDLAMARGEGNNLPISMAAEKGNEDMVRFLYDSAYEKYIEALICRDEDDEDQETLFLNLIKSNIFDVALRMAETLFCRTIAPDELEEAALEELAQIPLNPPGFLDRCINSFFCRQAVIMHANAVKLVELLWASLTLNEKRVSAFIKFRHPNPIIEAAKSGNFHFLSILISTYPDLLFICDRNKHTIIHHAILNRHVDIFKFLHIGSVKTVLTSYRDHEGNNMLHLSAKLAPPDRLNVVPGAALQLQRELLWFEEAKKVMKPHEVNRRKYYLSEFPLETMLSLVQKMEEEVDEVANDGGLFEKLKELLDRQSRESRKYHPSYQGLLENELSHYSLINDHKSIEDTANSMNQRDVVLLFKKLKKLMEQEYDQLEHFTEFWKMLDSFQEMVKEINAHNSKATGYRLVLNKTKAIVGRYYPLRYYLSQHQLLILLKEFNELMNGYWSNQSSDTDQLFEDLRTLLMKCPSSAQPTDSQFGRVNDFFLDIARLTNQHISDTGKNSDTATFFKELQKLTENYTELKDNPPRTTQMFEEMLQIFGEIDEVMKQLTVPLDDSTESILEILNRKVQWSNLPTHVKYKKVMDLFQEMKKVMEKHERNQNDRWKRESAHAVFAKEHGILIEKGEKWLRDTANSCMIVAVLITTIAFAAAITVPGGNADDGNPNFLSEIRFKAFAIADSVSMISSATSLLNFLSILTARYTIDDFRWSLPNKLFIGLFTLFVSIVAMMVAFVLSIFIIFKTSPPVFSILIAAASSVPIALFLWQHSSLFVDVFRSTYTSYFLFKPRNNPSSIFKQTTSFRVELKKTL